MSTQQNPGDRFAELARSLKDETDESDTIVRALALAVETITGASEAAVSMIGRKGRITTPHATGQRARQADQLQYEEQQGPCLDTIKDHTTTLVRDLAAETRWPHWAQRVSRDLGFGSVLCLQLYTTADDYGAMNLYADDVDAYDELDLTVGLAMAAHIAVALASARQIEHLGMSMHSRGVIGIALGVVMERYDLDQARAFQFLQRISATTGTRLFTVAEEIVATRRIDSAGPTRDVEGPTAAERHD